MKVIQRKKHVRVFTSNSLYLHLPDHELCNDLQTEALLTDLYDKTIS